MAEKGRLDAMLLNLLLQDLYLMFLLVFLDVIDFDNTTIFKPLFSLCRVDYTVNCFSAFYNVLSFAQCQKKCHVSLFDLTMTIDMFFDELSL